MGFSGLGGVSGFRARVLGLGSFVSGGVGLSRRGFGFRESFGLEVGVFGRGCHKIDHQQTGANPPNKSPSPKKTHYIGRLYFGYRLALANKTH